MSPVRVRKQVVCPECGRVLRVIPASAARVEAENLPDEDELDEAVAASNSPEVIETVVEVGPVCPRCAGE